jgi:hypothetical protein
VWCIGAQTIYMDEKGIINGLPAIADETLFSQAVRKKNSCRLAGAGSMANGTKEGNRGLIPEPIEVCDRLWICGSTGEKLFSRENGESVCMEWEHAVLREVIPIGKWMEDIERNPENRNDLEEFRGYAVLCATQKAEYVLTGKRMYLFRNITPGRREAICESADKKRGRRNPTSLPDPAAMQIALL